MRRSLAALAPFALLAAGACDGLATKPVRYTSVAVRAERRDGTPVPGVPLILYTGQRPMGYDTTNAGGSASFGNVPTGPAYGVLAIAPSGYEFPEQLTGGPSTNAIGGLTLTVDSTPRLVFRFLRVGPGTVVATVRDQAAQPIAGANVELYSPTATVQHATTSAAGTVTFNAVPFGVYGVRTVRPPAYRDAGESPTVWQDGLVVEDGVTATGALAMQLCQGTVNVTVADPAHGPAQGVRTYLYTGSGTVDSAKTAADGTVHYVAPFCGEFGVWLAPNTDWLVTPTRGSQFQDGIVIHRGSVRDVALVAQYNTCRGAVRVTVADALGNAIVGAALTLYGTDGSSIAAQTSANGTATFANLGCGIERGVAVTPPAGWLAPAGRGTSYVDGLAVSNGTTLDVTLTLTRAP